jgi:hypothetical protein
VDIRAWCHQCRRHTPSHQRILRILGPAAWVSWISPGRCAASMLLVLMRTGRSVTRNYVGESIRRKLVSIAKLMTYPKPLREISSHIHIPTPLSRMQCIELFCAMKNSNKKTKARIPCFVKQREGPGEHSEDTRTESRGMQECSPCVEVPGPTRCTESSKKG